MRYPVGNTGSKEEFDRDWYCAQDFGVLKAYGWHEGSDINLKTGGDTDLGQEVKAIANGRLVYYHYSSHPTTGFGRHLVYRIDGPWGSRWVMYSHLSEDDFLRGEQDVSEGQILGRLGKSGNSPSAHLHWSIYKVDPVGFGIDNYANTLDELNNLWEDPIVFVETWSKQVSQESDVRLSLLNQAGIIDEGKTREAIERYNKWAQLVNDIDNTRNELNSVKTQYDSLKSRIKTSVNNAIDLTN